MAYVSPGFEKTWGVQEEELYQNSRLWIDSIEEKDKPRIGLMFEHFLLGEEEFNPEFKIVRSDGEEHWISVQSERIENEDCKLVRVVGVAKDITKEKLVDIAKTEFVSLVSHQLKTPITSLSWDLEMLMNGDYGKVTVDQLNIVKKLYHTNMRMSELVDGLLNMSRIEMGTFTIDPQKLDVISVCEDVLVEMIPRIAKKQHEIIKKYSQKSIEFLADITLLRIIFQNIISNAIKYTQEKGKIVISVGVKDFHLQISVANNGIPIAKEDQPKIFSKMFRTSNAQEMDSDGTGLGLYLIKSIVENGGGKVWFESEKGKDTVFYVSFPMTGMEKKKGTKALVT